MAPALLVASGPAAESYSVRGEVVDADVPTTYRLPLVSTPTTIVDLALIPLFLPPPHEQAAATTNVPAQSTDSILPNYAATPAGSPPDEARDVESVSELTTPCANDGAVASPNKALIEPSAIEVVSYSPPAANSMTRQLLPVVQRGYRLAQRGALYAAREEFIQVLRRVAQSRDAAAKSDARSRALAAGLRALDEANDYVPDGIQVEAELDVRSVASSHRTRVLPEEPENVLPLEAVRLYHEFARRNLAKAAAGEQSGSMALHGIGKVYARLAERSDDDQRLVRSAMTMYSAALEACPDNHLAANELGVLICRDGRAAEAARLFERAIDFSPDRKSVV